MQQRFKDLKEFGLIITAIINMVFMFWLLRDAFNEHGAMRDYAIALALIFSKLFCHGVAEK